MKIPYISFEVRKEHILNEDGKNIIKLNVEMRKGKRIKLIYDSSKITCHDIEENSVESGDAVLERTSLFFNAKEGIEVAKWLLNGKIKDGGKSNSFHSYMKLEDAEENEGEKVITISIEEK